jgi:hypothetical protein
MDCAVFLFDGSGSEIAFLGDSISSTPTATAPFTISAPKNFKAPLATPLKAGRACAGCSPRTNAEIPKEIAEAEQKLNRPKGTNAISNLFDLNDNASIAIVSCSNSFTMPG